MADVFDLVMISMGPGGCKAAIEGVQKRMKVALVGNRELGGTCLNRGYTPAKTILRTVELYHDLQSRPSINLAARESVTDMETIQKRRDEVLEQLRKGIASPMKANRILVFYGTGTILDGEYVKVALSGGKTDEKVEEQPDRQEQDQVILETGHILIAIGFVPACPPISGSSLPGMITSSRLLGKKDLSEHLITIGGGVVGMEFTPAYSSLGYGITIVEVPDRILSAMDKEIAQNLEMIMKKGDVEVHTGAKAEEILRTEDGTGLICCYVEKDKLCEARVDGILVAMGRGTYTGGLMTDESSQEVKDMTMGHGHIVMDETYEASVSGIYAIGDMTGGVQLAHAVTIQGRNAVVHMAGENIIIRTNIVPSYVYTNPRTDCIEINVDEAKTRGIEIVTKKYVISANGKFILSQQERGFIKVVADNDSHHILGAQIACAKATDMISQSTVAVANELMLEDMVRIVFSRPAFSGGILETVR